MWDDVSVSSLRHASIQSMVRAKLKVKTSERNSCKFKCFGNAETLKAFMPHGSSILFRHHSVPMRISRHRFAHDKSLARAEHEKDIS